MTCEKNVLQRSQRCKHEGVSSGMMDAHHPVHQRGKCLLEKQCSHKQ